MEIPVRGYDSELSLRDLLSGISEDRLGAVMSVLLDSKFRVVAENGDLIAGETIAFNEASNRISLSYDLESVGYLETISTEKIDEAKLRAAVNLLQLLMKSGARYFMASEMHIEVVKSDYEELQRKHAALLESESRYKALAEQLDERVKEQVKMIDSAQRQLYQAEKMASIGQLAAGVAHEINNPIGFIKSNLSAAQSYVKKCRSMADLVKSEGGEKLVNAWKTADLDFVLNDFDALLQESISGSDRVARIVADLKGFSNVDQAEEESVNLNDNIRSVCNVAANQISSQAEIVLELGELPMLRCFPGQLNQVFLNLLLNAAQAMKTRGEIRIKTNFSNGKIGIQIADTGSGIPAEALPRIFDPFFTTRDVGQGTGLGLTVSRDVIMAHGGFLEVASEIGVGTTVTIYLPVVE
ncbi:sensor histidine kinase [Sulfurirhabdus autotrophica]|uniref:histidine kinase n=1 Tax=Sulfurirhabdus autotrophica TaxID=1706046 RepID=A0A4R3YC48_9PROT|nr:ATP-binding protein [Sulfurirhabdus autotrophica]TCV89647.1 phospho-acceptor domain-containing protein [Sulfurirhabdus autotrophica]